jgi:hypothetical protein
LECQSYPGGTAYDLSAVAVFIPYGLNPYCVQAVNVCLSLSPLFSTCHRLDTSSAGGVRCLVHAACLLEMPAEAEAPTGLSFLLSTSPFSRANWIWHIVPLPTHCVCCACRVVPSWPGPSDASAGCFVQCNSSHVMSRCVGLPARASGLIALLCTVRVSSNSCSS